MTSSAVAVDPLEWLASLADGAAGTDQERGAAAMAAHPSPGLAAGVGGADPAWAFASEDHAQAVYEATAGVCRGCEIATRCPTQACRIYRLEEAAQAYLEGETDWLP